MAIAEKTLIEGGQGHAFSINHKLPWEGSLKNPISPRAYGGEVKAIVKKS